MSTHTALSLTFCLIFLCSGEIVFAQEPPPPTQIESEPEAPVDETPILRKNIEEMQVLLRERKHRDLFKKYVVVADVDAAKEKNGGRIPSLSSSKAASLRRALSDTESVMPTFSNENRTAMFEVELNNAKAVITFHKAEDENHWRMSNRKTRP